MTGTDGLVERLEAKVAVYRRDGSVNAYIDRNPDGPEAAALIRSLQEQNRRMGEGETRKADESTPNHWAPFDACHMGPRQHFTIWPDAALERAAPPSEWFLVSDQMPRDGEIVYLWVEGPGHTHEREHFEVVAWPYENGTRWAQAYGAGELRSKPLMWRWPPTYKETEACLAALRGKQE